jgi:hypothetical protein
VLHIGRPAIWPDLSRVALALFTLLGGVVVPFAEGLPIAGGPEERHVTAMRNDVVDHGSGYRLALRLAADAQRVLAEEGFAGFVPLMGIAAGAGRGTQSAASIFRTGTLDVGYSSHAKETATMARFFTLTHKSSGKPYCINSEAVRYFHETTTGGTAIHFDREDTVTVTETVRELDAIFASKAG